MHAQRDPAAIVLEPDRQKLEAIAHLATVLDILLGDAVDALDMDVFQRNLVSERHGGQDGQLVSAVTAGDVQRRIGLRESPLLGLAQRHGEFLVLGAHV